MDVLKVGSKNYVKASVLARELGYTTDYVGQLCRARKVNAQLVGRSWYVDRDSIAEHKSTRYRSTQAKSIKAIQHAREEDSLSVAVHVERSQKNNSRFYAHSTLKPSLRYIQDEAELFPVVGTVEKKQGSLRVDLADAEQIKISNASDAYLFETPPLPNIKFKGSLVVTEAPDKGHEAPEGGVMLHPKTVSILKSDKKAHTKVISAQQATHSADDIAKIVPIDLNPKIVTEVVVSSESGGEKPSLQMVSILTSTVVSFACVVMLLGLESHVTVVGDLLESEYVFKIDHLVASVYSALEQSPF